MEAEQPGLNELSDMGFQHCKTLLNPLHHHASPYACFKLNYNKSYYFSAFKRYRVEQYNDIQRKHISTFGLRPVGSPLVSCQPLVEAENVLFKSVQLETAQTMLQEKDAQCPVTSYSITGGWQRSPDPDTLKWGTVLPVWKNSVLSQCHISIGANKYNLQLSGSSLGYLRGSWRRPVETLACFSL